MSSQRFRLVADVRAEIDPLHPAAACIGPDGDLWMIAYDRPPSETERANPDFSEPHELTVLNFREGVLKSTLTVRDPWRRSFVQPLGADEVLLVSAHTAGEPNAWVVDGRGASVRYFILGDGIEDVQSTHSGEVWVSYYDQGTFIGCWQVEGKSAIPYADRDQSGPIAFGDGTNNEHYGLLRTSREGQVSWRFTNSATIEPIFWCDGLNVLGDGSAVWANYSIFPGTTRLCPLVRIERDGGRRVWQLDGDPRQALAVHGETVLLGGDYGDDSDSLVLGRLGKRGAVEDLRPVGWIPAETDSKARFIGRGPVMHCVQGSRWYVLDLRD